MPLKNNDGNSPGNEAWRQYQIKGGRKNTNKQQQHHQPQSSQQDMRQMDERSGSPRSRRDGSVDEEPRKPKMFGRKPRNNKNANIPANTTDRGRTVKQMPFTDQFGDYGTYTGYVNDDGRPEGKGSMKYDNGVFYEGTWTDGAQDKAAASQYERIRGGFTSWGGKGKQGSKSGMVLPWNARKNDGHNAQEKTNVRGMEWTDLNGDSGRYTGEVNDDRLPHGRGIMKYSFGLIAEGDWSNGVLKEGPQDRMISAAASMAGGGAGMSVGPGGMSVGPGGMSIGPGVTGGMSVGPMSVGPMSMGRAHGNGHAAHGHDDDAAASHESHDEQRGAARHDFAAKYVDEEYE